MHDYKWLKTWNKIDTALSKVMICRCWAQDHLDFVQWGILSDEQRMSTRMLLPDRWWLHQWLFCQVFVMRYWWWLFGTKSLKAATPSSQEVSIPVSVLSVLSSLVWWKVLLYGAVCCMVVCVVVWWCVLYGGVPVQLCRLLAWVPIVVKFHLVPLFFTLFLFDADYSMFFHLVHFVLSCDFWRVYGSTIATNNHAGADLDGGWVNHEGIWNELAKPMRQCQRHCWGGECERGVKPPLAGGPPTESLQTLHAFSCNLYQNLTFCHIILVI